MRELSTIQNVVLRLGALLMIAGLCLFLFMPLLAFYLYSVGTLGFSAMMLVAEYMGQNFVIVRLRRQQMLGCVCLLLTAVGQSMQVFSYGPFRRNEWMVTLIAGTVMILYTAWRIPSELEKEANKS